MIIRTTRQLFLLFFLAISALPSAAEIVKTFIVIMPDKTVHKMQMLIQTRLRRSDNAMVTTITAFLDNYHAFVYRYYPVIPTLNVYMLEYENHAVPVTAISLNNLSDPNYSQQQNYWVIDSPPLLAASGALLLPVFFMDADSAYPQENTPPQNNGATAKPEVSKHISGYHYSAGLESNNVPDDLNFNFIIQDSGQLLQVSSNSFRITSEGLPQELNWSAIVPIFYVNKKLYVEEEDTSSLSSGDSEEDEELDQEFKKLDLSRFPKRKDNFDDDDTPSPPGAGSCQSVNTLISRENNYFRKVLNLYQRNGFSKYPDYGSWYSLDASTAFIGIILLLELLIESL